MSVYEIWQEEIYAGVNGMTESQLYHFPENESTVSHLVNVAESQHSVWVSANLTFDWTSMLTPPLAEIHDWVRAW